MGEHVKTISGRNRFLRVAGLSLACLMVVLVSAAAARPTDGETDPRGDGYAVAEHDPPLCSGQAAPGSEFARGFCIHWVDSGEDAPPGAQPGAIPEFVQSAFDTLQQVWDVEVDDLGFRSPKSDIDSSSNGGDGRLDVYLADIGDRGAYGYCESDDDRDPRVNPDSDDKFRDFAVYCVFDNDFSTTQFPQEKSGLDALRVTAAHEFFHAVQCSYDCYEDPWLVEGTAVWMEDFVFDEINDNLQYLAASPLSQPNVPLDFGRKRFDFGAWIFWRFLTEQLESPDLIREVWEQADASPGAPDMYSLEALESVLAARETDFQSQFASFALMNTLPSTAYEEGAEIAASLALGRPPFTTFRLRPGQWVRVKSELDHLTSRYVRYRLGRDVPGSKGLRLKVDFADAAADRSAAGVVRLSGSGETFVPISLDSTGRGVVTITFGPRETRSVALVLTNASTNMDCAYETTLSCGGYALDDDVPVSFSAKHLGN